MFLPSELIDLISFVLKATVDGYHDGIYHPGKKDFSQNEAQQKLIKLHPGEEYQGKWPTEFHDKSIVLTDQNQQDTWRVTYDVDETKNIRNVTDLPVEDFSSGTIEVRNDQNRKHNYVLVYSELAKLHCVYVKNLTKHRRDTLHASCINSNPNDKYPMVNIDRTGNKFYHVRCSAEKVEQPSVRDPAKMQNAAPGGGGGGGGGGHGSDDYDADVEKSERKALVSAIIDSMDKNRDNVSQNDIIATVDEMKEILVSDEMLIRFNKTVLTLKEKLIKLEVSQVSSEDVKSSPPSSEMLSKYIVESPVDFEEPEGVKFFQFFDEIFPYKGITYAYCKKEDSTMSEMINFDRKGNVFYKVVAKIGPIDSGEILYLNETTKLPNVDLCLGYDSNASKVQTSACEEPEAGRFFDIS